jgi:hypothetical protein
VQTKNFCTYIFTMGKTKTLREGIIVTGNRELLLSQCLFLRFSMFDKAIILLRVCQYLCLLL